MIIDCETYHVTTPMAGKAFGLSGLADQCREAGIEQAVVIAEGGIRPKNRELADALDAFDGTGVVFDGCAWLNPHFGQEAVQELEIAVREWGFVGFKLMPTHHNFRPVGKVAHPLMQKAKELGVPLTIHSGTFFAYPLQIGVLADAFPDVPVIMDHMGYRYYVAEAIAAAERSPNIYLATTAVMEPHWIRQAVQQLGADRVVFGSNAPHVYPSTQLLVVHQAELSEADERMVLSENAARLYKLN